MPCEERLLFVREDKRNYLPHICYRCVINTTLHLLRPCTQEVGFNKQKTMMLLSLNAQLYPISTLYILSYGYRAKQAVIVTRAYFVCQKLADNMLH